MQPHKRRVSCATGIATLLTFAACSDAPTGEPPPTEAAATSQAEARTQTQTLQQPAFPLPDFAVTEVTGPASVRNNETIEASVTVCNHGTETDSTLVSLFLSTDTVITPDDPLTPASDEQLEQFPVPSLAPGQCHTEQVRTRAAVNVQGTYFLGAIANLHGSPEQGKQNNSRASAPIGIGNLPDFVVTSVTGPASVTRGQPFPATVTVCNPGTAPGTPNVALYLSADGVLTPAVPLTPASDLLLASRALNTLAPGQCQTETLTVSASPSLEGAYHLGAIVDPGQAVPELIEINNTHADIRIGVGQRPDFVVSFASSPDSALPGQPLTASVQVCNQGTEQGSAPVELYLTPDDIITPQFPPGPFSDIWVGGQPSGPLNPGACKTLSFTGAPSGVSAGAYRLGAIVNPLSPYNSYELIPDNNTALSPRFGIGFGPDLIVTAINGPTGHAMGQALTATVEVCNQGTQPSGGTQVALALASSTGANLPVGTASVNALAADACETAVVTGTPTAPPGTYTLVAQADAAATVSELVEDNNVRAGHRVGVGMAPDFVVRAITAPASIQPGQLLAAGVEVCNQGTVAADTSVDLYVSPDAVITPGADVLVSRVHTNSLAPGDCQVVAAEGHTFGVTEGVKYVGAIADVTNSRPELFEDNNAHTGNRLGVGHRPDFIVKSVTAPGTIVIHQPVTATVEVCNQGTRAGFTRVELFYSRDAVITGHSSPPGAEPDYPLGMKHVDDLAAGQCQTVSFDIFQRPWAQGANNYLGAIVSSAPGSEFFEDNNTQVSAPILGTH